MIAFTGFVVIAQNTFAPYNISEPVFKLMNTSSQWFWKMPQHQLGKCRFRIYNARVDEFNSFHVGDNNYILPCCQLLQQISNLKEIR